MSKISKDAKKLGQQITASFQKQIDNPTQSGRDGLHGVAVQQALAKLDKWIRIIYFALYDAAENSSITVGSGKSFRLPGDMLDSIYDTYDDKNGLHGYVEGSVGYHELESPLKQLGPPLFPNWPREKSTGWDMIQVFEHGWTVNRSILARMPAFNSGTGAETIRKVYERYRGEAALDGVSLTIE